MESFFCQQCESRDEDLYDAVLNWWKTDSYGTCQTDANDNQEDERAQEILQNTCNKVDGRYETGLLWRDDSQHHNNRFYAERHLASLLQRLIKTPDLKTTYEAGVESDITKGYIRKVPPEEHHETKWLLPHYGLVNPNKPGKVRRKSNAAAKSNGVCLNDKLLRGPNLLGSLLGILLRCREKPVLFMAEIDGMFMQVGVRAQDRRYLRFLWTNYEFEEPEVYEYQRQIFGAKDSPTCAIYALQQTACDHKTEFPAASEALFEDFYMDDFIKSVNDVEEALTMQRNMRQLLRRGSFNLTKWCSNEITVCQKLPQDLLAKPIEKLFITKTLKEF